MMLRVLAPLLLVLALPAVAANPWPDRPIRIIVAAGSGSASDSAARTIARAMQKSVGQPVTVESGAVKLVKGAPPDGHTLLFATSALLASPDSIADLAPVAAVGAVPYAVLVNAKVPVRSVQELIAYGRANKLSYGTANAGEWLAASQFAKSAGLEMTRVAYTASPIPDVASGKIQVYIGPVGQLLSESRNSRVRLLATLTAERTPFTPNVPSLGEETLPVPPGSLSHQMFLVPAKTPPEIVARLAREVQVAVGARETKDALHKSSLIVRASSPGELAKQLAEEQRLWSQLR